MLASIGTELRARNAIPVLGSDQLVKGTHDGVQGRIVARHRVPEVVGRTEVDADDEHGAVCCHLDEHEVEDGRDGGVAIVADKYWISHDGAQFVAWGGHGLEGVLHEAHRAGRAGQKHGAHLLLPSGCDEDGLPIRPSLGLIKSHFPYAATGDAIHKALHLHVVESRHEKAMDEQLVHPPDVRVSIEPPRLLDCELTRRWASSCKECNVVAAVRAQGAQRRVIHLGAHLGAKFEDR
mmetsp:Transcript_2510/g.7151  ORF Transcript_2510/g.7151 Transcript_2510/m.7151 type:complete len:236 (+) Transcript_2510:478-1185(+)